VCVCETQFIFIQKDDCLVFSDSLALPLLLLAFESFVSTNSSPFIFRRRHCRRAKKGGKASLTGFPCLLACVACFHAPRAKALYYRLRC